LREAVTQLLFEKVDLEKEPASMSSDAARAELNKQFSHESYENAYKGAYLGRFVTIGIADLQQMHGVPPANEDLAESLQELYPESLQESLKEWRSLEEEIALLEAVEDGLYDASGGVIRHRGEVVERADLSLLISQLKNERDGILATIEEHDRRCRTIHNAAAQSIGGGWQDYLNSLTRLLHYVEHSQADLNDAHGHLANVTAMATATGRVSSGKLKRILSSANDLQGVMSELDRQAERVRLPSSILKDLEVEQWRDALDKLELPAADEENIGQWMSVVDGWAVSMIRSFAALRKAVLGELLTTEKHVRRNFLGKDHAETAPERAEVPDEYRTQPRGSERIWQKKHDWWSRFTLADGTGHSIMRFAVASTIVAAVVIAGELVGNVNLVVYNGLSTSVVVNVNDNEIAVPPFRHETLTMGTRRRNVVVAKTDDGRLIESFDESLDKAFANYVYNVGGAAPMVEWTAVYGGAHQPEPTLLGCPRWRITTVDHLFTDPPRQIETSGSGGTRTVLSSEAATTPQQVLQMIDSAAEQKRVTRVHAQWDAPHGRYIAHWLQMASEIDDFDDVLSQRLEFHPGDVAALRSQQDTAQEEDKSDIRQRHREAARQNPGDADWQYIGIRAMPDGPEQDQAFLEQHRKWPNNVWLSNAAGFLHARRADWQKAIDCYAVPLKQLGPMYDSAAVQTARIRRLLSKKGPPNLKDLLGSSELSQMLALESGENLKASPLYAFSLLSNGQVEEAYRVADGNNANGRLLVLLAASNGAKKEWQQRALQTPLEEVQDPALLLYLAALAFRNGQPFDSYLEEADKFYSEKLPNPVEFVKEFMQQGGPRSSLEDELTGLDARDRGIVLSTAIVMDPDKATASWRKSARALLFVVERPAF
jgi:hypothetical protein